MLQAYPAPVTQALRPALRTHRPTMFRVVPLRHGSPRTATYSVLHAVWNALRPASLTRPPHRQATACAELADRRQFTGVLHLRLAFGGQRVENGDGGI